MNVPAVTVSCGTMIPRSIEAEQALIGAVFVSHEVAGMVDGMVDETDFFDPVHQQIWDVISALRREDRAITMVTVRARMPAVDLGPNRTLAAYLAQMAGEATGALTATGPRACARGTSSASAVPERVARGAGEGAVTMLAPFGRVAGLPGMAADTFMGAVAGGTGKGFAEVAPEPWKPTAEVVGNVVGGGLAAAATEGAKSFGRVAQSAAAYPLATRGAIEREASRRLAGAAESPAAARAAIQEGAADPLVPGSQPTTFQATGDMGLGALEREVATKNPADFMQRRADQNAARIGAVEGVQATGAPEALPRLLRQQLDEIERATQTAVDEATQAARKSATALGGHETPENVGNALRFKLQTAEDAARQREEALWSAVDPDGTITVFANPIRNLAREVFETLPKAAKPISGEERGIFTAAAEFGEVMPFRELSALRSRVSTEMRAELSNNGRTPAYARLAQLRGTIEETLSEAVQVKAAQEAQAVARGEMHPDQTLIAMLQREAQKRDDWLAAKAIDQRDVGGGGFKGPGATVPGGSRSVSSALGESRAAGGGLRRIQSDEGLPGQPFGQPTGQRPAQAGVTALPELPANARLIDTNGPLGPVVDGFQDRWQDAVSWLSRAQTGDALGVLSHPQIPGRIDVVWGNPNAGLAKIVARHPEVLPNLPERLARMQVIDQRGNQIVLASADGMERAVVATDYYGTKKDWLLTAYERNVSRSADSVVEGVSGFRAADPSSPPRPAPDNIAPRGPVLNESAGATGFDEAARQRLQAATTASRERAQAFGQGPVGQVLRRVGGKQDYRLSDPAVVGKFFHGGPSGAHDIEAFRWAVQDDARSFELLRDHIAGELRRTALTKDGTIDPNRFLSWRRTHSEALRAFPDLDQRFATAARATEAIGEAAVLRKQQIDAYQAGAIGRVLNVSDPADVSRTIGQIFGRGDAVQEMRRLATEARKSPEALAGLRRAIVDHIGDRFVGNTEAATSGQALMRSDSFQTFISRNGAALREVFDGPELATLNAVAQDLQRANRSLTAVRIPGQSNTAQDWRALTAGDGRMTVMQQIVAATAGAGVGFIKGGPVGSAVGIITPIVAARLREAGLEKVDDLIKQAMLDPKLAEVLLSKVPMKQVERTLVDRLAKLSVMTGAAETITDPPALPRGGGMSIMFRDRGASLSQQPRMPADPRSRVAQAMLERRPPPPAVSEHVRRVASAMTGR